MVLEQDRSPDKYRKKNPITIVFEALHIKLCGFFLYKTIFLSIPIRLLVFLVNLPSLNCKNDLSIHKVMFLK